MPIADPTAGANPNPQGNDNADASDEAAIQAKLAQQRADAAAARQGNEQTQPEVAPLHAVQDAGGQKLPDQSGLIGIGQGASQPFTPPPLSVAHDMHQQFVDTEGRLAHQGLPSANPLLAANGGAIYKQMYETNPAWLNLRVEKFDPDTIAAMPNQVAALVTSSMPGSYIAHSARVMNSYRDWIENKDSFAGMKGAVTAARSYALSTHNQDWLHFINNVQSSTTPDQQQIIWAYLSDPNMTTQQLQALHLQANPESANPRHKYGTNPELGGTFSEDVNQPETTNITSADQLRDYAIGYLQKTFPHLFQFHAGNMGPSLWNLNGEAPDALSVATALKEMAPDTGLSFGLNWMDNQRTHTVDQAFKNPGQYFPWLAGESLNIAKDDVAAVPLLAGGPAGIAAVAVMNAGGTALVHVGNYLQAQGHASSGIQGVGEQAAGLTFSALGDAFQNAQKAISWGIDHVAFAVPRALGVDTNTQGWQQLNGVLSSVVLLGAFDTFGHFTEGLKEGRDAMTPEIGQERLNIADDFSNTNFNKGHAFLGRYEDGSKMAILNQWYTNPLSAMSNFATRVGFDLTSRTPEWFWTQGMGADTLDHVMRWNTSISNLDERVGTIQRMMGVPLQMAKDLAVMQSKDEMSFYMSNYVTGIADSTARLARLQEVDTGIRKQLSQINDGRLSITKKLSKIPTLEETPNTMSEAEARAKLESDPTMSGLAQEYKDKAIQDLRDAGRIEGGDVAAQQAAVQPLLDALDTKVPSLSNKAAADEMMGSNDLVGMDNPWQRQYQGSLARGDLQPTSNEHVFKDEFINNSGDKRTTYFYVDEEGKVQGYRKVNSQGEASTAVATNMQDHGNDIGLQLHRAHWDDAGIDTPEKALEAINENSMTTGGRALNRKAVLDRFGSPELRNHLKAEDQAASEQDLADYNRSVVEQEKQLRAQMRANYEDAQKTLEAAQRPPLLRHPERKFFKNAILRPMTNPEKVFNSVFVKPMSAIGLSPAGLIDALPKTPVLYDPFHADAPMNWREVNSETVGNWMRQGGMPEEAITRSIGELSRLKSPGDYDEWLRRTAETTKAGMMDKGVPLRIANKLTEWGHQGDIRARQGVTDGTMTFADGTHATQAAFPMERTDGRPIDSSPATRSPAVELPDLQVYKELTGFRHKIVSALQHIPGLRGRAGAALQKTIDIPDAVLQSMTNTFKGPSLVAHLPALMMRTGIEHALRAHVYGNYDSVTLFPGGLRMDPEKVGGFLGHLPSVSADSVTSMVENFAGLEPGNKMTFVPEDPRWSAFQDPKNMPVGSFMEDLMYRRQQQTEVPLTTDRVQAGFEQATPRHFDSWASMLDQAHNDPVIAELARNHGDIQAVMDRIQARGGIDEFAGRGTMEQLRQLNKDPEATDEAIVAHYLEAKNAQMGSLTRGDSDLMDYVSSGRMANRTGVAADLGARYNNLSAELDGANTRLQELANLIHNGRATNEDSISYRALQAHRRDTLDKMRGIEDQTGDPSILKRVNFGRRGSELSTHLEDQWHQGKLEMPDTINMRPTRFGDGMATGLDDLSASFGNVVNKAFGIADWADRRYARGNMYYEASDRARLALRASGLDEETARAWGGLLGARETRDIMYNLDARTSFQKALKNIFWFEPVAQDILYKWLVKIPAEKGWSPEHFGKAGDVVVGGAILAAKADAWFNLLKSTGVIQQNAQGQYVVPGPLATAFNLISGVKQVDWVPISSLNDAAIDPIPKMAPLPNWAVGKAASWGFPGAKFIEDHFGSQGDSPIPTFSNINYLWEATFGHPAPWDSLSPQYMKTTEARAWDYAIQVEMQKRLNSKDLPPTPEQFVDFKDVGTGQMEMDAAAQARYTAAVSAYTTSLMNDASHLYRVNALTHFVYSTFTPGSVEISTAERDKFEKLISTIAPNDPNGSQVFHDTVAKYVTDHPDSLAYSYWTSYQTGIHGPLPTNPNADFTQQFLDGTRQYYTADEYARRVQTLTSLNHYNSIKDQQLRAISPDLNPNDLLLNGFKTAAARDTTKEDIARYEASTWYQQGGKRTNVAADIASSAATYAAAYPGGSQPDYATTRNTDLLNNLKAISPLFTGQGGVTSSEYRTVVGKLENYVYGSENGYTPSDPTSAALVQYSKNVMLPYLKETNQLYTQAALDKEVGDTAAAAATYEKIVGINQKYAAMNRSVTWGGKTIDMPTPEQVFYGDKSPQQQEYARTGWATHPLYWNDAFQNETAGFPSFEGQDKLSSDINSLETQFRDAVAQSGITPASRTYTQWRTATDQQELQLGASFGQSGAQFVQLSQANPIDRLSASGFNKDNNGYWNNTVSLVQQATQAIVANGDSTKGYSAFSTEVKAQIYNYITAWREADPAYNAMWTKLSYSVPTSALPQREGAPLYEAILFDQWQPSYIPSPLISDANKLTSIGGA